MFERLHCFEGQLMAPHVTKFPSTSFDTCNKNPSHPNTFIFFAVETGKDTQKGQIDKSPIFWNNMQTFPSKQQILVDYQNAMRSFPFLWIPSFDNIYSLFY